jgi:hypothetical protein
MHGAGTEIGNSEVGWTGAQSMAPIAMQIAQIKDRARINLTDG